MPASGLEHFPLGRGIPVLALIAVLWGASLAMPALRAGGLDLHGIYLLLHGWRGTTRGIFAWYANPLFAAGFVCAAVRLHRPAALLAGVAFLLALESTAVAPVLRLEQRSVPELSLLAGFYAWLAAIIALCLWSAICAVSGSRPNLRCLCRLRLRHISGRSDRDRD
ncbi:MAG TPA: hypothetical protein VFY39_00890 [Gammaproteobacteria bacterium]|nr:hypothetical protein [Gammaproteobacteria bacterium]